MASEANNRLARRISQALKAWERIEQREYKDRNPDDEQRADDRSYVWIAVLHEIHTVAECSERLCDQAKHGGRSCEADPQVSPAAERQA